MEEGGVHTRLYLHKRDIISVTHMVYLYQSSAEELRLPSCYQEQIDEGSTIMFVLD